LSTYSQDRIIPLVFGFGRRVCDNSFICRSLLLFVLIIVICIFTCNILFNLYLFFKDLFLLLIFFFFIRFLSFILVM
jgi:hypothetical protein